MNNQSSKFKNQSSLKQPKVALVHDWLYGGGAEKVVLALHQMYPDAPIYTSYCTKQWQEKLNNKVVMNMWNYMLAFIEVEFDGTKALVFDHALQSKYVPLTKNENSPWVVNENNQ